MTMSYISSENGIFSESPTEKSRFGMSYNSSHKDTASSEMSIPYIDFGDKYLAIYEAPPPLPEPTSNMVLSLIVQWLAI